GLLRDIDRELDRRPEYETELAAARAAVAELSETLRQAAAALAEQRQEKQALEHQQSRLRDLDRRLAQSGREVGEIEAQMAAGQERLATYEATLARRDEVVAGHAALVEAREAEAGWNERLASYARVQERQRALERAVEAARHELELARGRLEERVRDLDRRAGQLPQHRQQLAAVRERLEALAEQQARRDAAQARLQALAEEMAGLKVSNDQMRAEMETLRTKLNVLQGEAGEAACPLCGQPLGEAHRAELQDEFETEGKALADAHRANTTRGKEIEAEKKRLEAEVQQLDRALADLGPQQRREAQLEQAVQEAEKAAAERDTRQTELAALQARLEAQDYAPGEQEQLRALAGELADLGYDPQTHEAARSRVASLAPFEEEHRRLQTALERINAEREALAGLRTRHERWQRTRAEDLTQREDLAAAVARLPEVTARVQASTRQVDDLQAQSSRARQALGAAQQKLDHCGYLAEERTRRLADRERVADEKALFDELRLAFGKKGIQAMIIEAAIPEIEYEANRLLARMTDGRMHVRFETQRETLKGD
ncbi:MAG: hypothetical protein ACK2UY_00915, partial [Anaerolineae bacterium]